MKFGEKEDESYFYDTSNLAKSKGSVTALFLKENTYDEKSYQLTKLSLDCKKKTYTTLEYSGYDGDGKQVFQKTYQEYRQQRCRSRLSRSSAPWCSLQMMPKRAQLPLCRHYGFHP